MKSSIFCGTLIGSLLLSFSLKASPIEDKIKVFKKAIADDIAAHPAQEPTKPVAAAYADTGSLMASLDQVPAQMGSPNNVSNAEIQISQILASYSSRDVQKSGQELLAEIHAERKAQEEAVAAEIKILLKRVSDDVSKAKNTEDLDAILADLQKFLGDRYGFNSENEAQYQEVSSAFEFTKLWQNYLSHLATGQTQLAVNDLQSINQNNYGVGLIPRSQILKRLASAMAPTVGQASPGVAVAPTPAAAILQGVKTLEDMAPALQRLALLPQNDPQTLRAYSNLAPLVQLYDSAKTGASENINLNLAANSNASGLSLQVQQQLLVFVLVHYLDSYKGAAPSPDEKPDAFLDRVIADAVSRQDWPLLRKAIAGKNVFNRNSALAGSGNVPAALNNLLAGVNQEAAAQYAMAVVSYQNSLKISDAAIPTKFIGDRLAAIKKDHPTEYEEGMHLLISSLSPR